jgi:hypothetical protein
MEANEVESRTIKNGNRVSQRTVLFETFIAMGAMVSVGGAGTRDGSVRRLPTARRCERACHRACQDVQSAPLSRSAVLEPDVQGDGSVRRTAHCLTRESKADGPEGHRAKLRSPVVLLIENDPHFEDCVITQI